MKRIIILGITGSIGTQAIECLENIELVGFSYFNNKKLADEIQKKFPNAKSYSPNFKSDFSSFKQMIDDLKPDLVLNAVSSWSGLELSKYCLENKIDLALANKETLVIAGKFIVDLAKKNNARIIPVDSEHTTLEELMKIDLNNVKSIYITASGGSFFDYNPKKLKKIKFNQAIKNPNWSMGERISVDSSTLVNKCYELIEAAYLFGFDKNIKAIRHKQSLVHSIVEFNNNSLLFSVSVPDMKLAIRLAINDFDRNDCVINQLSLKKLSLDFEEIDSNKYIPIKWFNEFYKTQNFTIPPIINIANEWCFEQFKLN
ncbi:MAG: 1-deoxy-D-xylulose 5-phosphate reductoisomerase, partial [Ureaplasma sp.]|nr:1-deoxy-D-xylulose 5-phosphate reductoisomerase [Ureaplasma sp.]